MFFKGKSVGAVDWLVVGLGNPEKKYEFTRHNAGFLALDTLAKRHDIKVNKLKFKSLCGTGTINGVKVALLKPSTYMNLSGQAVVEAVNFYKIPIERVIVMCDDVNLDPSVIRIRRKGTDGGQNGVKNIIYLTGADTFPRIKIGVGKKPNPQYDLADWVLSHFSKDEFKLMETSFEKASDAVELIVCGKIDEAMNKLN